MHPYIEALLPQCHKVEFFKNHLFCGYGYFSCMPGAMESLELDPSRQLRATIWLLGIEPRSFRGAARVFLTSEPSLQPIPHKLDLTNSDIDENFKNKVGLVRCLVSHNEQVKGDCIWPCCLQHLWG